MASPATSEPDLNTGPSVLTASTQKLAESWVADLPQLGKELVEAAKTGKSITEAAEKVKANETDTPSSRATAHPEPTAKAEPAGTETSKDTTAGGKGGGVADPKPSAETEEEKWPRSAADWEKRKTAQAEKLKARESEISQLKSKVQEYEKNKPGAPDPRIKELESERDQLSEQLRLVSIEKHPKFEKYYTGKVNAQIEMAKRIVGKDQGDKIASLLAMPESPWRDEQLNTLVNELPMIQQSRLGSVLNSLEEIKSERESEISRAKNDHELVSTAEKENQTKAHNELKAKAEKAFSDSVTEAQDATTGLFTYQLRDGDDEWNKGVKGRIELAKNLLSGGADIPTAIRAALYAVSLPQVLASHKALYAENEGLKAQVKALSSATPKVRNGTTDRTPETVPIRNNRPGVSPARAIAEEWGQELIKTRNQAMQEAGE